jgi:integrase
MHTTDNQGTPHRAWDDSAPSEPDPLTIPSPLGLMSPRSLLSDSGVPLEEISRLVGHSSTAVTELVYRKQIRPVLQRGATAMDWIFSAIVPEP